MTNIKTAQLSQININPYTKSFTKILILKPSVSIKHVWLSTENYKGKKKQSLKDKATITVKLTDIGIIR